MENKIDFLIHILTVNYSTFNGVIGQLKVPEKRYPLSLCISTLRNENKLIPDSCSLWDSDKLLFQGKLKSKRLRKLLERFDPCRLEITNSKDMEYGHGDYVCLCDSLTCPYSCECKAENYYEDLLKRRPELGEEKVEFERPALKDFVKNIWKDGWKKGRKELKSGNLFDRK